MNNVYLNTQLIIMRALNAKAHFVKAEEHLAEARKVLGVPPF